jgi:hypothetical protein
MIYLNCIAKGFSDGTDGQNHSPHTNETLQNNLPLWPAFSNSPLNSTGGMGTKSYRLDIEVQ